MPSCEPIPLYLDGCHLVSLSLFTWIDAILSAYPYLPGCVPSCEPIPLYLDGCHLVSLSLYLDGCRPEGEDLIPGPLGVSVHVDQDVDPVLVDPVGRLAVALGTRQVDKVFRLISHLK